MTSFYFGDAGERLKGGVSERLARWSKAYEAWVEERKGINKRGPYLCQLAWERLVKQLGKMPWEVTGEDIRQHMKWMEAKGYKKGTINGEVGLISNFYEWCGANGVDEGGGEAVNPAKGIKRLKQERFEGASVWSREEVNKLLELVGRDETVLGKREKAFFLFRLNSGVPLKQITHLKWGQIEREGEEAWVRWSERYEPAQLPGEVWRAIRDYLEASGRLEGMEKGKMVFSSLRHPYEEERGGNREDWMEDRPVGNETMIENLRVYGRRLGIDADKLNMHSLRRTALRLRLEAGESVDGMRRFMDSREEQRFTNLRLRQVPKLAQDEGKKMGEVAPPTRHARRFRDDERVKHGMYRHRQDMLAVRQVMTEGKSGMVEEVDCLRKLMRGLVELGMSEGSMVEVYTLSACRLGELLEARKKRQENRENKQAQEYIKLYDEMSRQSGGLLPQLEDIKRAAGKWEGNGSGEGVEEEVATMRLILRNMYQQAEACQEVQEYVHLLDLYGKGCTRLVRVLRMEKDGTSHVMRFFVYARDEALRQVRREMGLEKNHVCP